MESLNKQARTRIAHTRAVLESDQARVRDHIMATPTGEMRNALTDANIHLLAAIEALKAAEACSLGFSLGA